MDIIKNIFRVFIWMTVFVFLFRAAYFVGDMMFSIGRGETLISTLLMWVGISLCVFLVGAITVLSNRTIYPKRYLFRFGLTSLGVLIPLAIVFSLGGFALNADYEILNNIDDLEGILIILSLLLGLFGFFSPSWIRLNAK